MRITDFEASYLEIPFPEPGMKSAGYGTKKNWGFTLVKLFTDEDIVGIGGQEAMWPGGKYHCKIIKEAMKPILMDKIVDPYNVGRFNAYIRQLFPSTNLSPRPGSIEMALWDIIGKDVKRPIYKLLGARQHKVKSYINATTKLPRWEPDEIANFAINCLETGYRGIKTNIYNSTELRKDLDCVKAIRNAVGDEMDIMVDGQTTLSPWGNRKFSYPTALKIARELEKSDCLWLEDVIPYRINPDLCKRFAAEVDILISTGGQLVGAHAYEWLMHDNVVDVVKPDVMNVGGISELVKVADIAEMYNKLCCPHTGFCPGLITAATIQAAGATNIPYVESFVEPYATLEVRDSILTEPVKIEKDGCFYIPNKPGLGIELNEENIKKFKVW
ncbi:mandelate racemase/muconate lactonizing enzyme family protein [Thermoproteota archaeon]